MAAMLWLSANHSAGNAAGKKLLEEITAKLPRPFRACHIGAFHDDNRRWASDAVHWLTKLGAECAAPRVSDPYLDIEAACAAIERADFVYLDGGDTVAGVEKLRKRGLAGALRSAAHHAAVIFGLSGGACAAGPYTIGYRDDESPYVAECLDLGAPLPLDVHDEPEWPEMRALLALSPRHHEGIVIPTGSTLVVRPDGALRSRGKQPCELRSLARDGSWQVREIPAL